MLHVSSCWQPPFRRRLDPTEEYDELYKASDTCKEYLTAHHHWKVISDTIGTILARKTSSERKKQAYFLQYTTEHIAQSKLTLSQHDWMEAQQIAVSMYN